MASSLHKHPYPISKDRIQGMLIGLAVGDAAGAPGSQTYNKDYKFSGRLQTATRVLSRYHAARFLAVGQWTDDLEMTLCMIRSMIDKGCYNQMDVTERYINWARSSFIIDKDINELFKKNKIKTVLGYQKHYNRRFSSDEGLAIQSNSSLMRCSALALIYDNDVAIQDCRLTHPNRINIDCNLVYVNAVRLALYGCEKSQILETIVTIAQTDEVKSVLADVRNRVSRQIQGRNKDWVVNTLYCALIGLMYCTSYKEALQWVVNIGDSDTNTNGSVLGALVGAYYGYQELCVDDDTKYNVDLILNLDTSTADHKRPPEYTLHDFEEVTQQLYDKFASEDKDESKGKDQESPDE